MKSSPSKRYQPLYLAAMALTICTAPCLQAETPPKPETVDANLRATTITGLEMQPFYCDGKSVKVAVLVFLTTDCPVANRYAPELERIRADVTKLGVTLTLVHVDPDLTEKAAYDHAEEYSLKAPVVIDRAHQLVAATGVSATPEAVVIDSASRIRYRGRINDQFTDFGSSRMTPSTHDLRDAIHAVLEGRKIEPHETKPVGCLIPKLKKP